MLVNYLKYISDTHITHRLTCMTEDNVHSSHSDHD